MELQKLKTKEIALLVQQAEEPAWPQLLAALQQDSRRSVQAMAQRLQRQMEKREVERRRIAAMWQFEQQAKTRGYQWIAGTDEVGRGPLAGPVVAAAVILPENAESLIFRFPCAVLPFRKKYGSSFSRSHMVKL